MCGMDGDTLLDAACTETTTLATMLTRKPSDPATTSSIQVWSPGGAADRSDRWRLTVAKKITNAANSRTADAGSRMRQFQPETLAIHRSATPAVQSVHASHARHT